MDVSNVYTWKKTAGSSRDNNSQLPRNIRGIIIKLWKNNATIKLTATT